VAFEIKALRTDEARRRIAEMETTGKNFKVVGFQLGNAGHDPLDPTTALAPDPSATEVASSVFGPKEVASFTYANDSCPVWECVVEPGEGVTLYSSIGLLAQILSSPVPGDAEVDTTFLFALAHLPQRAKLDTERLQFLVGIQG
jgi:hypothetical protein